MATTAWFVRANQELSEIPIAKRRTIFCEALLEDLFAMRYEQQRRVTTELFAQSRIVEGGDDGFTSARGCDYEVPHVAVRAFVRELIERY